MGSRVDRTSAKECLTDGGLSRAVAELSRPAAEESHLFVSREICGADARTRGYVRHPPGESAKDSRERRSGEHMQAETFNPSQREVGFWGECAG